VHEGLDESQQQVGSEGKVVYIRSESLAKHAPSATERDSMHVQVGTALELVASE
jgi:hypothetical protein